MDWKKFSLHTCVYFTAITTALLLSWLLVNYGVADTEGFSVVRILCFLPFSALFAFGNINFKYSEAKIGWRVLFHFLFTVGGAFVFLYLPSRVEGDSTEAAVAMVLILTVLYWILMGTFLALRSRILRIDRDSKQYKSLYRNNEQRRNTVKSDADKNKQSKKNKDDYQNAYKKN